VPLYLRLREYDDSWADFDQAGTVDPNRPPWERVVRACSQELERNPANADAYHLRARARERLGRWQEALDDYGQAIQRAPRRWEFAAHRGWTYLLLGQKDRAAEDFRKASEGDPEQANDLAWALATSPNPVRREPGLAVELANQAVRQAPGVASYRTTLGIAYYRLGEWQAAVQALQDSERLEPGKRLGFNALVLAMCQYRLGDSVKARDQFDRAVRWTQDHEAELGAVWRQELETFRVEGKALLNVPPGP
jgi:tetratricopeptide (TPR) repeat protein